MILYFRGESSNIYKMKSTLTVLLAFLLNTSFSQDIMIMGGDTLEVLIEKEGLYHTFFYSQEKPGYLLKAQNSAIDTIIRGAKSHVFVSKATPETHQVDFTYHIESGANFGIAGLLVGVVGTGVIVVVANRTGDNRIMKGVIGTSALGFIFTTAVLQKLERGQME